VKAVTFVVSGRVQGVWFRGWTEGVARTLGVHGWVANRADGRVEGYAEGSEEAIALFLLRLHSGPPSAKVDDVAFEAVPLQGATTFEVRR